MKRFIVSFAVLSMLAVFTAPATASDLSILLRRLSHNGHRVAQQNHVRHHQDLDHRAYHRELSHNEAHRYPMSYRQHGRLHDSLNHEAYHDAVEHSSAHQTRAYRPTYGYGLQLNGPSRYYGPSRYNSYPRSGISFSFGGY